MKLLKTREKLHKVYAVSIHASVHLWESVSLVKHPKLFFTNLYFLKLGTFLASRSIINLYHLRDNFIFLHRTDGKDERSLSNFFSVKDEGSNGYQEGTKYTERIKQSETLF